VTENLNLPIGITINITFDQLPEICSTIIPVKVPKIIPITIDKPHDSTAFVTSTGNCNEFMITITSTNIAEAIRTLSIALIVTAYYKQLEVRYSIPKYTDV